MPLATETDGLAERLSNSQLSFLDSGTLIVSLKSSIGDSSFIIEKISNSPHISALVSTI